VTAAFSTRDGVAEPSEAPGPGTRIDDFTVACRIPEGMSYE
jgi:hypothetical protein